MSRTRAPKTSLTPDYQPVQHALTAPTPTSPNAAAVLNAAIACAQPGPVGSEHILWALFNVPEYSPRILEWIAKTTAEVYQADEGAGATTPFQWFRSRVMATLIHKGFTQGEGGGGEVVVTESLQRILVLTQEVCNRPVRDGDKVFENGLVSTEFIVAAILRDGTSVASDIISRCSRGLVNSWNLCEAINVDPTTLHPPQGNITFETRAINAGLGAMEAWEPDSALPAIGDGVWCAAPLACANWLIPGRLMIGETPGGDSYHAQRGTLQTDLAALVPAHVDTYVCLRGEWGPMDAFMANRYPAVIQGAGLNCNCMFFPIEDYRVTHDADVVAMVLELRRRLRSGERLYIHCHSGHGRTGMIAIPLIASLFNIPAEKAMEFVQEAHDIGRNHGEDTGWALPETNPQQQLVRRVNQLVCQADLGQARIGFHRHHGD